MRTTITICLLAALLLGGLIARAADDGEEGAIAGKWEGRVLFTNGWAGRVIVTFEKTGKADTYRGKWVLAMLDEDGSSESRGEVEATRAADGSLKARLVKSGEAIVLDGRIGSADPHAKAAFFGTFAVAGDRGVFMLYRYAR